MQQRFHLVFRFGVYSNDSRFNEAGTVEGYLRPMRAHNWDRAALLNFKILTFPNFIPYNQLEVPVLMVTGDKDPLTATARKVAALLEQRDQGPKGSASSHGAIPQSGDEVVIPGIRYVEFGDCGHMPMEEDHEEFAREAKQFIKGVLQPSGDEMIRQAYQGMQVMPICTPLSLPHAPADASHAQEGCVAQVRHVFTCSVHSVDWRLHASTLAVSDPPPCPRRNPTD